MTLFCFSIGRVNPQLYALGAGTWNFEDSMGNCQNQPKLDEWMLNYVNVLCINSWQVLTVIVHIMSMYLINS